MRFPHATRQSHTGGSAGFTQTTRFHWQPRFRTLIGGPEKEKPVGLGGSTGQENERRSTILGFRFPRTVTSLDGPLPRTVVLTCCPSCHWIREEIPSRKGRANTVYQPRPGRQELFEKLRVGEGLNTVRQTRRLGSADIHASRIMVAAKWRKARKLRAVLS